MNYGVKSKMLFRGVELNERINKYGINILNNPNSPSNYKSILGTCWIDIVLSLNINMNKLVDFKVWDEITFSS